MTEPINFLKFISIWIFIAYVSAEKPSQCDIDLLIRKDDKYIFNYENFDDWGKESPICKKGKLQSPINLGPNVKTYKVKEYPLKVANYEQKPSRALVQNNRHSVQLKAYWEKNKPTFTGPIVNGEIYEFYSIILHWGTGEHNGTEHSIHGKKYAAELHILQKNVKYNDIKKALKEKDGLIVTALLFEHNKDKPPNKGIQQIAKLASKVTEKGSIEKADFDMTLLDFHSIKSFYTYVGSLTRPPCSEHIRWFVSGHILPIDNESLKHLRSVKLDSNDHNNIRPIQDCHGREVKFYTKIK